MGNAFQLTMIIFAVISIALFWITFATTKERVTPKPVKSDIKADLKALVGNGPWIALFLAAIFILMNVAVRNGTLLYYFKYYVGEDGVPLFLIFDKTAVFMSLGLMTMVIGITLTKFFSTRFDKRNAFMGLMLINAVTMAIFYVIPPEQYWLMVAVNCLSTFASGPTAALVWAMYADTADYGEWKTGRRTTALVFSTVQFAQKLGLAVGAGMAGIILGIFGFVANEVQTEESLNGIRFMYSVLPAILAVLGVVAVSFYRINATTVKQIEHDLLERRGVMDTE